MEDTVRKNLKEQGLLEIGKMGLKELWTFLHSSTVHFSRRWVNLLGMEAPTDDAGFVPVEPFITAFHEVFNMIVCNDITHWIREETARNLGATLVEFCQVILCF